MKIGVCFYPACSLAEISQLTSSLSLLYNQQLDYLASSSQPIPSEEGILLLATKQFSEVRASDYDLVILPGTLTPYDAINDVLLIKFLSSLNENTLVAAISTAPYLLGKAGLLKDQPYTGGLYQELLQYFDFMERSLFQAQPVVVTPQIVTGVGFAYREWTMAVFEQLGFELPKSYNQSIVSRPESDYIFHLTSSEFQSQIEEIEKAKVLEDRHEN